MVIYHITSKALWESQKSTGYYKPDGFGKDGFIHCSTSTQVATVANRFYHGQPGLVVLEIDASPLGELVVFENLEGGSELFPHIYAPLDVNFVKRMIDLKLDSDYSFIFPSPFSTPLE